MICHRLCRSKQLTRGRCRACDSYWRRHGTERPPEGLRRLGRPCINCGRPAPLPRRGRCQACYMYWWRKGIERPVERVVAVAAAPPVPVPVPVPALSASS
ncbi:MAG TPA: hypothetical protein VII06_04415 [Chloroflexota bacterium]